MAGKNFYYDGDGDGIMDDVGYAYFQEDETSRPEHYHNHHKYNDGVSSSSGVTLFELIFSPKGLKSILIGAGICLGVATLVAIIGFIVFAIYHIVH